MEETTRSLAWRKCSSAARSRHLSANRFVPSVVARSLMYCARLLGGPFWELEPLLARLVPEGPAAAHRRASFCDKASPFRERKFLLRGDCCKTSGPGAIDFR